MFIFACYLLWKGTRCSQTELVLEIAALRQQLALLQRHGKRPRLSCFDRWFWILLMRQWPRWRSALVIVKPVTVIRWHRLGFRLWWRWQSSKGKKRGRPRISREKIELIKRLARENPTWGAPRIAAELAFLGFSIGEATVGRYLPKRPPNPKTRQSWQTFLKNHRVVIAAIDFLTLPDIRFKLIFALVVLHHGSRKVKHFAATYHPTAQWIKNQLREAFPYDQAPQFLITDRDTLFSGAVYRFIERLPARHIRTMFRSPWQNGFVERVIGSFRRECFDHVIPLSPVHVERLAKRYITYYHQDRPHQGLHGQTPFGREVEPFTPQVKNIIALPRCNGLHHRYVLKKTA